MVVTTKPQSKHHLQRISIKPWWPKGSRVAVEMDHQLHLISSKTPWFHMVSIIYQPLYLLRNSFKQKKQRCSKKIRKILKKKHILRVPRRLGTASSAPPQRDAAAAFPSAPRRGARRDWRPRDRRDRDARRARSEARPTPWDRDIWLNAWYPLVN